MEPRPPRERLSFVSDRDHCLRWPFLYFLTIFNLAFVSDWPDDRTVWYLCSLYTVSLKPSEKELYFQVPCTFPPSLMVNVVLFVSFFCFCYRYIQLSLRYATTQNAKTKWLLLEVVAYDESQNTGRLLRLEVLLLLLFEREFVACSLQVMKWIVPYCYWKLVLYSLE